MKIYRKYTVWGRRINIGKGEMYCPRCNGRGCMFGTISTGSLKTPCGFCQGDGKTDWIQIATNEPKIQPPPQEYINYLKNNFEEYVALCLTKDIDNEIMNSLITSGMEVTAISLKMMKEYAKSVGDVVVTANQAAFTD